MALRYDRSEFKSHRDASTGFLYSDSVVARTGILLYRNPDGTARRELRLPAEAGSAAALTSMKGKPIVVTHKGGNVNKDNARGRVVGTMLSGRQDGPYTRSELVVMDGEAIKKAESGELAELSLGYKLRLDETPGYYHAGRNEIRQDAAEGFEPFDAIQRDLEINHVAFVPRGRAGSVARLNLDGDEISDEEGSKPMPKITLGSGVQVEVSEEVAQHVGTLSTRLDGVNAELNTTKGTLAAVQAETVALKNEIAGHDDKIKQARADALDELRASDALRQSIAHKVKDTTNLDDVGMKKAFITAVMPTFKFDGLDDNGIGGAFAALLASNPASAEDKNKSTANHDKHVGGDQSRKDAADEAGPKTAASAQAAYHKKLGI